MWDRRYGGEDYEFGTEPNEFLAERLPSLPRDAAMCVAEGEGRNAVFLAQAGYAVSSVDLSEAGVEKTRRLAADRGVRVDASVGDLATFDLGREQWDLVVSIFAHMPADMRRDLHRRIVQSLKPGGVLLLEAYTPDQIGRGTGGPSKPEFMMTLAGLRDELAPLEFEHGAELVREIREGPAHVGLGAVVQVIARRAPDAS